MTVIPEIDISIPENDLETEITNLDNRILPLIKKADSYIIETSGDVDNASLFLKQLREAEKQVEEKRLEFTKPLNESLKAINGTFKTWAEPLEKARTYLTNKILNWRRAEQQRIAEEEARIRKIQEEEQKKLEEANAKIGITAPVEMTPVVLSRPEAKIGNVQTRKVWNFRITDLGKVPKEYLMLNGSYVRQEIRNGVRKIEGLEIYQEEQLSIVER